MMDSEPDEMRSLGVVGICKEAYNILQVHLRLFLSLSLTLVLPLGAVIFCHDLITHPLWRKIHWDSEKLGTEQMGSAARAQTQSSLDSELFGLGVITVIYVIFILAFSLLSTAAIVYSVASIYTGKGLSYVKVISVVPKVWKRLFFTFVWAHILIFLYYVALFVVIFLLLALQSATGMNVLFLGIPVLIVFYTFLFYFNVVWHLASVVSVLEDSYGINALKKSTELIKGKRWVGCCVFLIYTVCTFVVLFMYNVTVRSHHHVHSLFGRVFFGLVLLLLWTAVTLIGILVQTVVYFVCKSYHHESIDRYALSEHLDGYLGEYMPLKGPVSLEALEAELEEI
ncbi:uncharacterized protein [Physcomitrium patens]|uniref:Uncharacterized protein n=1 Tax=Physcomitrium patens TaxID=3218 RepID=A9TM42_PHYPA|nr:uncharacterized protein LOC112282352 [Physcomitrium patens]XP_024375620.1 uncharacterized protein LOC112282352 [Physcomitrium patens]XP_024375621.1 uncharacterized protein LOC112282352 [Physcomitrium patens]XP_024375622.1 uncharacterized protein LOC112282352 [Physcomitrium patens]XP_024375623.1 uncharacterized protein LOC112282352 [Physcomitrium patens]XP_024375624.1 uncharacterized protein LOC112282352 [Physcomitrium patens]XP_024375625.1 uncharacterized protein LOC112282352 [Physcomitriu|eukprot:XP_024375619.1 uncharacterized protein LOC112282352 [Physcomitrella patens]